MKLLVLLNILKVLFLIRGLIALSNTETGRRGASIRPQVSVSERQYAPLPAAGEGVVWIELVSLMASTFQRLGLSVECKSMKGLRNLGEQCDGRRNGG